MHTCVRTHMGKGVCTHRAGQVSPLQALSGSTDRDKKPCFILCTSWENIRHTSLGSVPVSSLGLLYPVSQCLIQEGDCFHTVLPPA